MLQVRVRPLTVLTEADLDTVHTASLRILSQVGVEVLDGESLALLGQAGACVDADQQRAYLPADLVQWALSQAPSRFAWQARNPAHSIEVGGDQLVLLPVGGPSLVRDLEGSRRPGSYADQVAFVKLAQLGDILDAPYKCVEANDLPPATRHLDYLSAAIRYSDKPLAVMSLDEASAHDALALAGLVFGEEPGCWQRCLVLGSVNVDSPLRFGHGTLRAMLAFARAGQPLLVTPFILPGILSPATSAGALAQQNAENLAAVVLAQAARPGTPVIYGSFAAAADMRYATPVFGGAEAVLLEIAAGQLAGRYGLPHRGMGLVTTAQAPDAQAAWEKMTCLNALAHSNTHVLLHACGWLEGGLTASFEQFVLDLEMLASARRYLKGLEVDERSLGMEAVTEVGPGGSYLLTQHTLAHHRDSSRPSSLLDDRPSAIWQGSGAPSLLARAQAIWKRCLEEYAEPPLDPGLEEAVRDFVARRKGVLAGAQGA